MLLPLRATTAWCVATLVERRSKTLWLGPLNCQVLGRKSPALLRLALDRGIVVAGHLHRAGQRAAGDRERFDAGRR